MDIQREKHEHHTIEAYSANGVQIKQHVYSENLIVSAATLLTSWSIEQHAKLTHKDFEPLLALAPEIILIGSDTLLAVDPSLRQELTKKRIGLECMSIGSACRTFNILLNESRKVALGLIFSFQ